MEHKTIDDLVATLSEEEKEKLGNLIDECRDRERLILAAGSELAKNLEEMYHSAKILMEGLLALEKLAENMISNGSETNKYLGEKLDAMLNLINRHNRDLENARILSSTPVEQMSKA
jgi:hypothetical protein